MSGSSAAKRGVRAAVAEHALEVVCARAPTNAVVVALQDDTDLERVDFLVPPSQEGPFLDALPHLSRLRVVQVLSAGTDWIEARVPAQATLCSARGARDAPVSEWVVGALLGASTGLLECARLDTWTDRHLQDLGAWQVLIVGMGSIGRMVQRRLSAFGTQVTGVGSHAHDDLHGVEELPDLLPGADAVVVLAPLTDATHRLIGTAELAAMADGAVIVNAARGPVLDTDALLAEVQTGRLRAVLDVTDPEPLPDGHPLWSAPGLLSITPHVGGDSPRGNHQAVELAAEQLARFCAGEELLNIVKSGSD